MVFERINMKKITKIIIVLVLVLLVIGVVVFRKLKSSGLTVKAINLQNLVVRKTVTASGVVKSENFANLSFPVLAKIQKVNYKKGDFVKKGNILAIAYNYSTYQDSQAAKDNRDITKRDLDQFVQQYGGNKFKYGGIEEYDINLRKLKEVVNKAEDQYQSSLGLLENTYIKAPFDGSIVDITKKEGELSSVSEPLIKLADTNNLIFEMEVDQEDFGSLSENQSVEVTLDSFGSYIFNGIVYKLPFYANIANETGQNFTVEIKLPTDSSHKVLYGMNGDASILVETTNNNVKALQFDAIFDSGDGKKFVWVLEDNKLKKLSVQTGIEGDFLIEIKSDMPDKVYVPADEKVVLKEGKTAKVIE